MSGIGILIFILAMYIAFNIGKAVGRAQSFFKKPEAKQKVKKNSTTGIEEADYEEIN
ncbi:MAG: hypothetical protein KAH33_07325 [Candidatus Delongbacteria bacterium]|nr:hypothetical protein [Candidatus Delongbacteria bacterium]